MRLFRIGLLIILLISITFGGCAKSNNELTNKPLASQEIIELKFNEWLPPESSISLIFKEAAKKVQERSNGRVKIVCYFAESLVKYDDIFNAVASGICDITSFMPGIMHGATPLDEILWLPFFDFKDQEHATKVYREILQRCPEIEEAYVKNGVKWLDVRAMPPFFLHTVNKQARVPDDLKGSVLYSSGISAKILSEAGVSVVNLPPGELYTSLEKGILEGMLCPNISTQMFQTMELCNYHTSLNPSGGILGGRGYLVNLEVWEKLPPEIQQILIEVFQWASEEAVKEDMEFDKNYEILVKQAGHEFLEITPQEAQLWKDLAEPFIEDWILKSEAEGWPARRVYEITNQIIKEVK